MRYLVFAGEMGRARGGWRDFVAGFDLEATAVQRAEWEYRLGRDTDGQPTRWAHVVNVAEGVTVWGNGAPA